MISFFQDKYNSFLQKNIFGICLLLSDRLMQHETDSSYLPLRRTWRIHSELDSNDRWLMIPFSSMMENGIRMESFIRFRNRACGKKMLTWACRLTYERVCIEKSSPPTWSEKFTDDFGRWTFEVYAHRLGTLVYIRVVNFFLCMQKRKTYRRVCMHKKFTTTDRPEYLTTVPLVDQYVCRIF